MRCMVLLVRFLVVSWPFVLFAGVDDDKPDRMRDWSVASGHIVGAASSCEKISAERINATQNTVIAILQSRATSETEVRTYLRIFSANMVEGLRWVGAGQITCPEAERQYNELEAAVSRLRQSNPQYGPSGPPANPAAPIASLAAEAGEIRLGACLPLTGLIRDHGHSQYVGLEAAVREANDAGGIHGKMLKLVAVDDGYDPQRTVKAMQSLIDEDKVFAIAGSLGTPTAIAAVPIALSRHMLFFAPVSGSPALRRDPPDRYVFNYRPSYAEETYAAVRYLIKIRHLKPEQIAVFAQQDGLGDAGFAGVTKAVRALSSGGDDNVLRVGYARNTISVEEAVAELQKSKPPRKAIVMVAVTRPAARFIEKTRDVFPDLIYTNTSSVSAALFRDELKLLGVKYASGVIVTNVVPDAEGYSSIALQFKSTLAKYMRSEEANDNSFEGYISMKILIEALRRAGPQTNTEKLVDTLESMQGFDPGVGAPLNFSGADHQAIHKVWGAQLTAESKYEPIELE